MTILRKGARRLGSAALLLCLSCRNGEPSVAQAPVAKPPATQEALSEQMATETDTPEAPPAAVVREALPRTVVGVALGMSRADADGKVGPLTCHDNKEGFEVCNSAKEIDEAHHIELYVHHGQVISVAYEGAATAKADEALNRLIDRYGEPSLRGMRERDKAGRLHEIYGWKDDQSLYSVRFVWRETESHERQLIGLTYALWDRKGYQLWEAETKQRSTPTVASDEPREPI